MQDKYMVQDLQIGLASNESKIPRCRVVKSQFSKYKNELIEHTNSRTAEDSTPLDHESSK